MSGYKIDINCNTDCDCTESYERIYRDRMLLRDRYYKLKKTFSTVFIVSIWFFIFSAVWLIISLFLLSKLNEQKDITLKERDKVLAENVKNLSDYSKALSEKDNEISQLQDRIIFLIFSQAINDDTSETVAGVEETIEELETEENSSEIETVSAPTRLYDYSLYTSLFSIGENVPLPDCWTNTYRCMDYRKITDKTSWQYNIQTKSQTNLVSGLRYYTYNGEKYYTVALATAYGIDLGNAYEVELKNGTIFKIVHAEYKHDIRYPSKYDYGDYDKNYDEINTISVIEFVYDELVAPSGLIQDGEANRWLGENCSIYGDGCNIVRMTYLGKIWHPKGE